MKHKTCLPSHIDLKRKEGEKGTYWYISMHLKYEIATGIFLVARFLPTIGFKILNQRLPPYGGKELQVISEFSYGLNTQFGQS